MARLPQPGSDKGTWGDILNEFLSQALNADGTLKPVARTNITGLSPVAGSGSYTDLTNKPAIPSTKADVGLGNVDNTSDASKPISSATQSALDGKVDKITGTTRIYAVNPSGTQTGITYSSSALGSTIMFRTADGTTNVATPVLGTNATTKDYVDAAIAVLQTAQNSTVTGPASAADSTIPRFSSTTGKALKTSNVSIDDNDTLILPGGNVSGVRGLMVGSENMTWDGGIGAPAARFTKNIDAVAGIQMANNSTGNSADFRFSIIDNNSSNYLAFALPGGNNAGSQLFSQSRSQSAFIFTNRQVVTTPRNLTIGTVYGDSSGGDLILGANNAQLFRIKADTGYIGINTPNPQYLFDINGNARVAGTFNAGNGYVAGTLGIGTSSPTHALTIAATNSFALYNTTDQTTNYERLRILFTSNAATLQTDASGTGSLRSIVLNGAGTFFTVTTGPSAFTAKRDLTASNLFRITSTGLQSTSGIQEGLTIDPTIAQTGTVGYTILKINPTESTVGSGAKLLADFQVNSASKFKVANNGQVSILDGTQGTGKVLTSDANGNASWQAPTSGGITRTITQVTTATTAGATANVDYVYWWNGSAAYTLTMPTAAANTNRYTFKNQSSLTQTITTTSSQLIDNTTTYALAAGTSLVLISNGTGWMVI